MNRSPTLDSAAPRTRMPYAAHFFMRMLAHLQHGWLRIETPTGSAQEFGTPGRGLHAELHILDWRACRHILSSGDIGLAHAWREGWIKSPDITAVLRLALRNQETLAQAINGTWLARCWFALQHRLRPNTRRGSRANIHAHYDIGNDFYRLWLDESMTYSAALFEGEQTRTLTQAQDAKYQRILDSLQVQPGQTILEIGCGWGGFASYAASKGIAVHGVTISAEQLAWGQAHLQTQGLSALAQLELRDYRDLDGQYDAIVSIEMFEAVGEAFWPTYFRCLQQRLKPGGRALVQSITIDEAYFSAYRRSSDFIRDSIFPGGMLPSPERFIEAAQHGGLTHVHSHAFGADYAETLRLWRQRFVEQQDAVVAQGFDAAFLRTWLLYLSYCEAGFDEKRTDVYHFLLQA